MLHVKCRGHGISIHALLAESDLIFAARHPAVGVFLSTLSLRRATETYVIMEATKVISIHALLAESDTPRLSRVVPTPIFLSTLSLRRATQKRGGRQNYPHPISIHALLAESDLKRCLIRFSTFHFYPRSPCGERPKPCCPAGPGMPFLSTLSLRRATVLWLAALRPFSISIHALLAESDRSGIPVERW